MALTVAIVGRPNVGKSTLFNRLVGKRLALVDDTPGVTRDRREATAEIGGISFGVIDTAGLEEADGDSMPARMRRQTDAAIADADLVLFMIDARAGVTPLDRHFADILRRSGKPLILIANKCEGRGGEAGLLEAYELGLGEPVALSAEHGEGLAGLLEGISDLVQEDDPGEGVEHGSDTVDTQTLHLSIVGRPNAGKSTLINRLIGDDRVLTGPEAGITRDSIAIDWTHDGRPVRLFDTAGLRRKSRITGKLEKLSVADAMRAIRFSDVVVVLIDATQPLEKQDRQIADRVEEEGRAIVLAVNKWDLIETGPEALEQIRYRIETGLAQIAGIEVVPLSAKTGDGVEKLMPAVWRAHDRWNRRIATAQLNRWLADVIEYHPPPAVKGKRIKLRYITQPKARPPTFTLFCNRPAALPESYKRYLVNDLRETFDLPGVPVRLLLRKGDNPYA